MEELKAAINSLRDLKGVFFSHLFIVFYLILFLSLSSFHFNFAYLVSVFVVYIPLFILVTVRTLFVLSLGVHVAATPCVRVCVGLCFSFCESFCLFLCV